MVKRNKLRGGFDLNSITGAASEWTTSITGAASDFTKKASSLVPTSLEPSSLAATLGDKFNSLTGSTSSQPPLPPTQPPTQTPLQPTQTPLPYTQPLSSTEYRKMLGGKRSKKSRKPRKKSRKKSRKLRNKSRK
jgi:hypothetical protein